MLKKLLAAAVAVSFAAFAGADEKPARTETTAKSADTSTMTIVEIAAGSKNFTKLVAAVKAADLADTLSGTGPFTVFAPTDKAFEALGDETLNKVLADKDLLTKILMAHVVKDKAVLAADVIKMDGEKVNGFTIKVEGEKVILSNSKSKATVTKTDIKAKNGVIHVIDAVLIPEASK